MATHGMPRGPRTRTDEQKRLDAEKISTYHELETQMRQSTAYDRPVFDLTTRLLRLNPEYYTAWNVRRRCLISSLLSGQLSGRPFGVEASETTESPSVSASSTPAPSAPSASDATASDATAADRLLLVDELFFTIPLLLEFPKCYWIWSYRLWVLEQAVQRLPPAVARRIWEDELALDSQMLTKDRRNFHAWGYRRQVVARLESPALAPPTAPGRPPASLVEAEFAYTTKMIHRDLSNFSAWHNRSKLIPRLLDERGADDPARKDFFESELGIVREALNVGPEDQSLWFYHQFLMLNLTDYTGHPTITPRLTREERMTYVARELADIKDLLLDYDDVKWIYEALLEYTLAVAKMDERPLQPDETAAVQAWLARLRALDPKRNGRWDDIEREHVLHRRPAGAEEDA